MEGFENITAARLTAALGGDRELLIEIIELYLRDAPSMLQSLREATGRGHAPDVARAAHVLKGSSANFGLTPLYEAARELEHRAFADAELSVLETQLARIETAASAFERALQRLREEMQA
jgi:HPt (histidine-containing phosphotransfer) domain-containing protein